MVVRLVVRTLEQHLLKLIIMLIKTLSTIFVKQWKLKIALLPVLMRSPVLQTFTNAKYANRAITLMMIKCVFK